jgi:predicted metal-dependent HD superfamily phosphohydrolase
MLPLPAELMQDAEVAWSTPGRAYHTWEHALEMMDHYDAVAREIGWRHPREVALAVVYHDAVYVPGSHDNEAESAKLAHSAIARWTPGADAERVEQLILLTAQHGKLSPAGVDDEAALFLDCDMAILAAGAERFAEYERQIAREYSVIPPELYAAGRRKFLETVLALPRIYLSDYFHARLDARARENLRRALG